MSWQVGHPRMKVIMHFVQCSRLLKHECLCRFARRITERVPDVPACPSSSLCAKLMICWISVVMTTSTLFGKRESRVWSSSLSVTAPIGVKGSVTSPKSTARAIEQRAA